MAMNSLIGIMLWHHIVVFGVLVGAVWSVKDLKFPPGFKFGAATSSYQIEGAWNVSGKGEGIWDRFVHTKPEAIVDAATGDVACNSYNLWKRDIEIAKELNLHFYRFSIAWTRILPTGFHNKINKEGIEYYSNLIDGLLAEGIEPMVTIYHWELPQSIQDLGGWANPKIVDWFGDYARILYTHYGSRVKSWLTINEPIAVCDIPCNMGTFAPGIVHNEQGFYLCNRHVLLAHARAYRIYEKEFKSKYHGKISIVNMLMWFQPLHEDEEELNELTHQYSAGRYSHAIYSKEGGWPPAIEEEIRKMSLELGYAESLLPAFTEEEIKYIRGTYDFYAVNYYTSRTVCKATDEQELNPWPFGDLPHLKVILGSHPEWPSAACEWLKINPKGIRQVLVWLKNQYGDLEYYITENGMPSRGGTDDQDRIKFLHSHLEQVLLAIKKDGVNVTRYTVWSLMDNFEWPDGYSLTVWGGAAKYHMLQLKQAQRAVLKGMTFKHFRYDTFQLYKDCQAGRYSHPIYTQEGGWPVALEIAMAKYSNEKGYAESLLPSFTEEEIKYIRATYDFYAFNYYTSRTVRRAKKGEVLKPWVMGDAPNVGAVLGTLPDWPTESCDIKINPKGLRNILVWLKCKNCPAWTILILKISERFGLYEVDFQDPKRTRTPRASAKYFANVIKHHSLIPSEKD